MQYPKGQMELIAKFQNKYQKFVIGKPSSGIFKPVSILRKMDPSQGFKIADQSEPIQYLLRHKLINPANTYKCFIRL